MLAYARDLGFVRAIIALRDCLGAVSSGGWLGWWVKLLQRAALANLGLQRQPRVGLLPTPNASFTEKLVSYLFLMSLKC